MTDRYAVTEYVPVADLDTANAELALAQHEVAELTAELEQTRATANVRQGQLQQSRTQAATYANEIGALKAELERKRQWLQAEDRAHDQTVVDRDQAQDMADRLADAIAKLTGVEIGEHSSGNDPWMRALDAAEAMAAHRQAGVAR